MLLLFSLVTCSPCGYGQICLAVICLGYKQNECQNVPKTKIWGKSLEKVKKLSVKTVTTHIFAVDATCYNQAALAIGREGGNFCTVALLRAVLNIHAGIGVKCSAKTCAARLRSWAATARQLQRLGLKAAGKSLALCAAASHAGKLSMAVCLAKG